MPDATVPAKRVCVVYTRVPVPDQDRSKILGTNLVDDEPKTEGIVQTKLINTVLLLLLRLQTDVGASRYSTVTGQVRKANQRRFQRGY